MDRLRQILLNLVGNAIKFTETGEVALDVEDAGLPSTNGDVALRFAVRDTGIGIEHDQQERIFRAFEQVDTSTTRKYGGTGLGLSIAARLVALMGGSITLDSAPGAAAPLCSLSTSSAKRSPRRPARGICQRRSQPCGWPWPRRCVS